MKGQESQGSWGPGQCGGWEWSAEEGPGHDGSRATEEPGFTGTAVRTRGGPSAGLTCLSAMRASLEGLGEGARPVGFPVTAIDRPPSEGGSVGTAGPFAQ